MNFFIEKVKYERYASEKQINNLFKETPSIEARLTVLSLAKKQQILEFIKELDSQNSTIRRLSNTI